MKRILSLLLCLSLLLGALAFAEDGAPFGQPEAFEAPGEEAAAGAEPEMDADGTDTPEVEVEAPEAAEAPGEDALALAAGLEAEAGEETGAPEAFADRSLEASMDPAELAALADAAGGEAPETTTAGETTGETDAAMEEPEAAEAGGTVLINAANFPDPYFRAYVKEDLAGGQSYLTSSQIASIREIRVSDEGIFDLTGIRLFTSVESINCGWNYISELDVSNLTRLKVLYCEYNYLQSLNVSGCAGLQELYCDNNWLSGLDVSGCARLQSLSCDGNQDAFALEVGGNAAVRGALDDANIVARYEGAARFARDGDAGAVWFPVGGRVTRYGSTVYLFRPALKLRLASLKLGVQEKFTLVKGGDLEYLPGECSFKSSDKAVAKVSASGVITPLKPGRATITVKVRSQYGAGSATCAVTVKKAPTKVALNRTQKTVLLGRTFTLKPSFPGGAYSRKHTFRSSNTAVATVDSKGVVTAKQVGTATITVKAFNGRKASCRITVQRGYQALLVCQPGINSDSGQSSTRFATNTSIMKKLLENRKAPQGTYKGHITVKKNVNRSELHAAIDAMAARAKSTDVTLFFIATHGYTNGTGASAGSLAMYGDYNLTFATLAGWLKQIPGKVVVILSSCGSGAAVYANGAADDGALKRLNQAAVDAFRDADGASPGALAANTGELRDGKFYVLTSSAYQQLSWGRESGSGKGDWFVRMIRDGVGTGSSMPADANGNRVLTLNELKAYIDRREKTAKLGPFGSSRQFVQIYPEDSGYKLLRR